MSDDGEEPTRDHYGFYGKALEPYDEESIPKRKPISVEDQIATDAQGRRRFHGAFTGGFSAGFFNSVGSLEGWRPAEFKSSRSEKAENRKQKPEDYMDDEDIGEFGIAPQKIKATKDFNTSKKRKRQMFADGPIPGEPVLHTLIESGTDTIGYLLLRNMGYKHCAEEDEEAMSDEEAPAEKIYGCQMPKGIRVTKTLQSSMPEEFKALLKTPKTETFGMGYSGLDRSHINLFTSTKLVVNERNNKKLSITGQAFGVGAFEEDDEDIYVKEDLSRYDFELTGEKSKTCSTAIPLKNNLIMDMFVKSRTEYRMTETFPPPTIPRSFTGKHRVKKSRFTPAESNPPEMVVQRRDMDASIRAKLLREVTETNVSKKKKPEKEKVVEEPKRVTKFDVPPRSGLILDKFVSAGKSEEHTELLQPVERMETQYGTKEMREAAKMKMFGPLTRTTITWLPNSLVCKRFNIPEPVLCDSNEMKAATRRHRNLIFENAHVLEESAPNNASNYSAGLNTVIATTSSPQSPSAVNVEEAVVELRDSDVVSAAATGSEVVQKKALDPTDKLDISKNVDLFKAVFVESDSDSEDNETAIAQHVEEARERQREIETKIVAEDLLVPKIKPIRHGILSNVESAILLDERTMSNDNDEKEGEQDAICNVVQDDATTYGPSLPTKITFRKPGYSTNSQVIDKVVKSSSDSDDWIEMDKSNVEEVKRKTHKKRHLKKHKKERHRKKAKHKRQK